MSILDNLANSLADYQRELWRDRLPYLTKEGAQWVTKQGGSGCRPVKGQAAISMEKSPSPLPEDKPKPVTTSAGVSQPPTKTVTIQAKASTAATAHQLEKKKEVDDCPPLPPFDMMDLPSAMDAMGFKYAAKFARKWFEGKAHVIEDEKKGQPAIIQLAEFVDKDTLKLDWILKIGTVRERYEHLLATGLKPGVEENIYNQWANDELVKTLSQFMVQHNNYFSGTLDTLTECDNDIQKLHQQFQFQHVSASMVDVLGGIPQIVDKEVHGGEVMNDLAASLANFNLYVAIATAKISTSQYMRYSTPWQICTRTKVEITHIWVYAKDSYSFNDKTSVTQYLGHWNSRGVIVASDAFAAYETSKHSSKIAKKLAFELGNEPRPYLPPVPDQMNKPVDTGSSMKEKEVFYPVRNRDFRNWRDVKKRGGDFVIFSNCEKVKLPTSIVIDLSEVCREYKS